MKSLWEKLAYCAEVDVNLPGSLTCDAWDEIEARADDNREARISYRVQFELALLMAVDAYLESPVTYEFNRRAV